MRGTGCGESGGAATCYTWLADDDRAEEHARETIQMYTRPAGSSNAPMRVADAHIDLGIVHARRGDLDAAVDEGMVAFDIDRRSLTNLTFELDDAAKVDPGQVLIQEWDEKRQQDVDVVISLGAFERMGQDPRNCP
ncbi:tetratricopeptide repeat protein [Nonomuraea sp. NPDC050680]|uniref:tetratricopeptide repeat protein n=1 Tax=Nonomuraea sp. NPDC050680 TaxID=3154630 RepID=UPI0033CAAEA1